MIGSHVFNQDQEKAHFVYLIEDRQKSGGRGRPQSWELRYWDEDGRAAVFKTLRDAKKFAARVEKHYEVRIVKGWATFPACAATCSEVAR